MFRKEINRTLIEEIKNKDSVALLFSGGVDSLSMLFSCFDVGIRPTLYCFTTDGYISEDLMASRKVADIFGLSLKEIYVPTDIATIKEDVYRLMDRFKIRKPTQIQCTQPFLYVAAAIKEEYAVSGICADDILGNFRACAVVKKDIGQYYSKRYVAFNDIEKSSFCYIRDVFKDVGVKLIAPYKTNKKLAEFLFSKNFDDLHRPKQKQLTLDYYKEIEQNGLYRKSSNAQVNSRIREEHLKLLTANQWGYTGISGIYNRMYYKYIADVLNNASKDHVTLNDFLQEFKIKLTGTMIDKINEMLLEHDKRAELVKDTIYIKKIK